MRLNVNTFPAIFIVGSSRSGTSLMARILGTHPRIYTFQHELHFFEEIVVGKDLFKKISLDEAKKIYANLLAIVHEGYFSKPSFKFYLSEAEKYIKDINDDLTPANIYKNFLYFWAQKNNKFMPCEQTPKNIYYLEEIFDIFPQVKIINMMRDPRDVLLSQKNRWRLRFIGYKNYPFYEVIRSFVNYNPIIISKLWRSSVMRYEQFKNDSRVINVKFEDLILNFDAVMERICNFLEISMDFDVTEIPVIGSSFGDSVKKTGLIKDMVFRWKKGGLSSAEIYFCQKINGILMESYGYKLYPVSPSYYEIFLYILTLIVKAPFMFFFNWKKCKNFKDAIVRRFVS